MSTKQVGRSWHRLYPDRWRRELAALREAGLAYRITYPCGGVRLLVNFPIPDGREARLRVDFGLFPWFPPTVADPHNELGATRHRNPVTGGLCLIHEEIGWDPNLTIAELLSTQLPKILAAGQAARGAIADVELPIPEGAHIWCPTGGPAVLVPAAPIPDATERGALIARFDSGHAPPAIAIEEIHGPDWHITQMAFPRLADLLPATLFGQWLRMPDFNPAWTTRELTERILPRVEPIQVEPAAGPHVNPDHAQLVGLRVPGEPTYRRRGEEWLFVLLHRPGGAEALRPIRCRTQTVGDGPAARTPTLPALRDKHVTVVGIGAVGHHIATGLGRAGVARLDLIDRDVVDVNTRTRQFAPLWSCGAPKAHSLAAALLASAPTSQVNGFNLDVADLGTDDPGVARARSALAKADLVIDATANSAATRYVGALRHATGKAFLHASATAGAWGGVVTLSDPTSGCWACVEHHRHDHQLPVPPADPDGWIAPVGCGAPTFTGDNAALATIAGHALRVATAYLTGEPGLGHPGVWVGSLRDELGVAHPIAWETEALPVHPACPLHDPSLLHGAA